MGSKHIVFLDGYNVIHRIPGLRRHLADGLHGARRALVSYCAEWLSRRNDVNEFYVVFDGNSEVTGGPKEAVGRVRVIYSETGESADDRIAALVATHSRDSECVVVSADNEVIHRAVLDGATIMSPVDFHRVLATKRSPSAKIRRHTTKAPLPPDTERQINEDLKEEWGIK